MVGVNYEFTLIDARTGEVLTTRTRCVDQREPLADVAPPDPPTVVELFDAVELPAAQIQINPATRGITGMDSWFWANDPGVAVAEVTFPTGWRVTGEASVTAWAWTVEGEGYSSSGPGSEADPAVTHSYDRKGTDTVTVERTWTGSYTMAWEDVSVTFEDLTTSDTGTVDYDVIEVVSVVDDPDADAG